MASKRDNIERKDDKTTFTTNSDADTTTSSSSQQQLQQRGQQRREQEEEQHHHAINRALDETKDNIRKTTDEARSQIPRYTQSVNDYQNKLFRLLEK